MAGETNPTGQILMTNDTGKRLSDADKAAELVILLRAVAKGTNHIKSRQSIIFEAAADALERLTANRGSVSEEMLSRAMAELERQGRDMSWTAMKKILEAAAIQQAVSECSGGGACCEGMREKAAKAICPLCASGVRIDNDPSHAGSHGQFVGYHVVNEESDDGLPDWEECLASAIRALPLPPSPVSRDAQKPVCGTYHSRAIGVACSNCGHLKEAHSREDVDAKTGTADDNLPGSADDWRSALKSTPHQGGEGK